VTILLALTGTLLVAAALYDVLKTTLSAQGGAPTTSALSAGVWSLLGRGGAHSLSRRAAGGAVLLVITLAWTVMLWTGWVLVFSSQPDAVVDATSSAPAPLPARIYFVGYTLFTMGNGDYVPVAGAWQAVTAIASFSGLFLVTLAITYLLPVVQAVAHKRTLAGQVHALGSTGAEIASQSRGPGSSLERQLERIASDLTLHAERHLVYPVIHYFVARSDRDALPTRLAALDDALLLLRHGLDEQRRPDPTVLSTLEDSLDGYLETVRGASVTPSQRPAAPSPPDPLADLPDSAAGSVAAAAEQRAPQRRLLRAIVDEHGADWPR
jgi:hypothetical protein